MVKYLEAAECICLAISVCNLIAVGFAMKKQKSINKIIYFVNISWHCCVIKSYCLDGRLLCG